MIILIPYFREIKDNKTGFVYSLDNVVMKFRLYWAQDNGAVDEVFKELSKCCHVCDSFTRFGFAQYKHQFIFHMPDGNTFWVGIGFNGSGGVDYSNCSVDFNPNKVGQYDSFVDIHNKLLEMSKEVELKRYDLAVDIPVSRENFIGFKDKRIGQLLIGQNLWLSLLGAAVGLPVGILTLDYLLKALAGEYEMQMSVSVLSILVSILLTVGMSLLVSFFVARKNRKIDMVEALKGAE